MKKVPVQYEKILQHNHVSKISPIVKDCSKNEDTEQNLQVEYGEDFASFVEALFHKTLLQL
jgi:hypothetical protein